MFYTFALYTFFFFLLLFILCACIWGMGGNVDGRKKDVERVMEWKHMWGTGFLIYRDDLGLLWSMIL